MCLYKYNNFDKYAFSQYEITHAIHILQSKTTKYISATRFKSTIVNHNISYRPLADRVPSVSLTRVSQTTI